MQKQPQHKKEFVPSVLKVLIATSSLAGTLGIWNFIASKDIQAAEAQGYPPTPTLVNTDTVQPPTFPTIAPLVVVNIAEGAAQTLPTPLPTATLRAVNAPKAAPPAAQNSSNPVILSSNSDGQSSSDNNPAPPPTTTTRSSR